MIKINFEYTFNVTNTMGVFAVFMGVFVTHDNVAVWLGLGLIAVKKLNDIAWSFLKRGQ